MRFLHVNDINGLLVEYNKQLVLIQVDGNEDGNLVFLFKDPFTDAELLNDDEARCLLLELMVQRDD
ncbi:hypothetical protein HNP12_000190 [Aeromonas hydrophila]|uniref:hypothetical protein n=1 Tax=Aeromonas hydrophila TaxID=644 RepID=UPI00216A2297|nr:hypothetical protein [Aeromonas hydrophila]MCS3766151.1 hypothetical protein [Aeromonas hydrophila]